MKTISWMFGALLRAIVIFPINLFVNVLAGIVGIFFPELEGQFYKQMGERILKRYKK